MYPITARMTPEIITPISSYYAPVYLPDQKRCYPKSGIFNPGLAEGFPGRVHGPTDKVQVYVQPRA